MKLALLESVVFILSGLIYLILKLGNHNKLYNYI
jgi:hypothetical protein